MFEFNIGTRASLGSCNRCLPNPMRSTYPSDWEKEQRMIEVSIVLRQKGQELDILVLRLCNECFDTFLAAAHDMKDPR